MEKAFKNFIEEKRAGELTLSKGQEQKTVNLIIDYQRFIKKNVGKLPLEEFIRLMTQKLEEIQQSAIPDEWVDEFFEKVEKEGINKALTGYSSMEEYMRDF